METSENPPVLSPVSMAPAGFGRRLGAIFYDLLLLAAVLIFAAIPFVLIIGSTSKSFSTRLAFQLYLLAISFLYYGGFWVRGRTLGLLTWKLKVVAADGGPVTWVLALKRFAAALFSCGCLGLGLLWALVDREKLGWHDRLSGTRLIRVN